MRYLKYAHTVVAISAAGVLVGADLFKPSDVLTADALNRAFGTLTEEVGRLQEDVSPLKALDWHGMQAALAKLRNEYQRLSNEVVSLSAAKQQIARESGDLPSIRNDSIASEHIVNGTIQACDLKEQGITGDKLVNGTVTGVQLARAAVVGVHLGEDAIESRHIRDRGIQGRDVVESTITGAELADRTIRADDLADGCLTSRHFAPGSVPASAIAGGTIAGHSLAVRNNKVDFGENQGVACGFLRVRGASGANNFVVTSDTGGDGDYGYVIVNDKGKEKVAINGRSGEVICSRVVQRSDLRLKGDIQQIPNALQILDGVRGVSYVEKDATSGGRRYGVIAQEVQAVFPEAVVCERRQGTAVNDEGANSNPLRAEGPVPGNEKSDHGATTHCDQLLYVDYSSFVAVFVEAIKKQELRIRDLESRVQELQGGN